VTSARPGGDAAARLELPPRDPVTRRRAGFLLTLFGAVGLLLFGVAALLVANPVDENEGPLGLEGQRRRLVAMIDASSAAIAEASTAAGNVDGSLASTAAAARSAGLFMSQLATTMQSLSASLRVSILGSQPFAGAADDFDRTAAQAATVAADLERAAGSVELAAGDIADLSADLAELRTELGAIRDTVDDRIESTAWRLVLAAMLAWLAIPAAVSLALGLRWLGVRWTRG
jgi:hypothetical protein